MISRCLSRFAITESSLLARSLMQNKPSCLLQRSFSVSNDKSGFQEVQSHMEQGQSRISDRLEIVQNRKEMLEIVARDGRKVSMNSLGVGLNHLMKIRGSYEFWSREERILANEIKDLISERLATANFITPIQLRFMTNFLYILRNELGFKLKQGDAIEIQNRSKVFIEKNASFDQVSTFLTYTVHFNDRHATEYMERIMKEKDFIPYREIQRILKIETLKGGPETRELFYYPLLKTAQIKVGQNLEKYSPAQIVLIFRLIAGFLHPEFRLPTLVKKIAVSLEEKMEDLDQNDVQRIIESFATYRSQDQELVNLIQRIHKLIDLGLQHNASSFNVDFIEHYVRNINSYDSNFKPSRHIVKKSVEYLLDNKAVDEGRNRMNTIETLLKASLVYKIESPQIYTYLLQSFKSIQLARYQMDKIKHIVSLALRYFSLNKNKQTELEELKNYFRNVEVSSDFMKINISCKLLQIAQTLNEEQLIERRIDDLLMLISQTPLQQVLSNNLEEVMLNQLRFDKCAHIAQKIFSRENLADQIATLSYRKLLTVLQFAFHSFKDHSSETYQNLENILKNLRAQQLGAVLQSYSDDLIKTANDRTISFLRYILEKEELKLNDRVKRDIANGLYDRLTHSFDYLFSKEEALRFIILALQQTSNILYHQKILQRFNFRNPAINKKLFEAILPEIESVQPGTSIRDIVKRHGRIGFNLHSLAVNFDGENQQIFQTLLNAIKIYSDSLGERKQTEESSSSSSSDEEEVKNKPEFLGFRGQQNLLRINMDMMIALSELILKIPSSLSEQAHKEARNVILSAHEKLEGEVRERYHISSRSRGIQEELIKMIFAREAQLDTTSEGQKNKLAQLLQKKEGSRLTLSPLQWMEVMRCAARTDLQSTYFEFPAWRRGGFKNTRRQAIYLLIQDYKKLGKRPIDFQFDQTVFNFVTQHRIRDINFINAFIQRLGDNFSKLGINKIKRVPISLMRAGLKQSDIFKSIASKFQTPFYQRNIFPSLFTNGVRLQMHSEEWFLKYAEDFFNTNWDPSRFSSRGLIFLLEGAYSALDQPGTEFLHEPIKQIVERLSKMEKIGIQDNSCGEIIYRLLDDTDLVPEQLKIQDEELKKKLKDLSYFQQRFDQDMFGSRLKLGQYDLVEKINEEFGLTGEDQVKANEGTISGILIPNSNRLILPLIQSDLLFDLTTPNHLGTLKRRMAEKQGFEVTLLPIGPLKNAKNDEQIKAYFKTYLGEYFKTTPPATPEEKSEPL